jgi:hypothetical protein
MSDNEGNFKLFDATYSVMFTFSSSAVTILLGDVIFAQLASLQNDAIIAYIGKLIHKPFEYVTYSPSKISCAFLAIMLQCIVFQTHYPTLFCLGRNLQA